MDTKECSRCKQEKPLTDFYRDSNRLDGKRSECKACYYYDDTSRILDRANAQYAANPDHGKDRAAIQRARKAGSPVIETVLASVVFNRDEGVCQHPDCGQPVDPELSYPDPMSKTIDHTVPISAGGAHSYANVTLMHWKCNQAKGTKLMEDLVLADAR